MLPFCNLLASWTEKDKQVKRYSKNEIEFSLCKLFHVLHKPKSFKVCIIIFIFSNTSKKYLTITFNVYFRVLMEINIVFKHLFLPSLISQLIFFSFGSVCNIQMARCSRQAEESSSFWEFYLCPHLSLTPWISPCHVVIESKCITHG